LKFFQGYDIIIVRVIIDLEKLQGLIAGNMSIKIQNFESSSYQIRYSIGCSPETISNRSNGLADGSGCSMDLIAQMDRKKLKGESPQ